MLPIECIVRGYITGSGWASYQKDGTVCGIKLPEGLRESDKLPEPIYTPSTKAEKMCIRDSMDSIQTVLSMTTFLRFTLSSSKSSIPSLRTDNGPLLLPAAGSDQHFSKHYCAFSPDYLFHPAAVKQKK